MKEERSPKICYTSPTRKRRRRSRRKKKKDEGSNLQISRKNILSPLWKFEVWEMETGRTDYCGK
jgi:hypothetical protein